MKDKTIDAVYMCAGDTGFILDNSFGGIPQVCYWGPALGTLTPADVKAAVISNRESLDGNAPDDHVSSTLIPLESDGWLGRPALAGHRADGTSWSPRFKCAAIELPENCHIEDGVAFVDNQPVAFSATSEGSQLALKIFVEPFEQGPLRIR
ncbi:alpha-galactosidase, partial [Actinomyces sp. S6-Spd3]